MISISHRAFLALPIVLVLTGFGNSQPATMSWPEAVAQLTAERTRAETCVALLKRYGDKEQVAHGQLTYTNAEADAVIAGLITALSRGQEPASVSSLQVRLSSGFSGLAEFCNTVGASWCPKRPDKKAVGRASWPASCKAPAQSKRTRCGEQHLCSDDVLSEINTVSEAPNPMLPAARVEIWRVTRWFSGRRTCNATRHLQV